MWYSLLMPVWFLHGDYIWHIPFFCVRVWKACLSLTNSIINIVFCWLSAVCMSVWVKGLTYARGGTYFYWCAYSYCSVANVVVCIYFGGRGKCVHGLWVGDGRVSLLCKPRLLYLCLYFRILSICMCIYQDSIVQIITCLIYYVFNCIFTLWKRNWSHVAKLHLYVENCWKLFVIIDRLANTATHGLDFHSLFSIICVLYVFYLVWFKERKLINYYCCFLYHTSLLTRWI